MGGVPKDVLKAEKVICSEVSVTTSELGILTAALPSGRLDSMLRFC